MQRRTARPGVSELWRWLPASSLLGISLVLFLLRYLHLAADFPHHTWPDWARYTDEGWYSGAAQRQIFTGQWRVPGDFNPAVALPVFPGCAYVLFRLTGVSLVALRAANVTLSGAALLAMWSLLRRTGSALPASAAVFVCCSSMYCFAYARLSVVETMLTCELMLTLLAVSWIDAATSLRRRCALAGLVGLLLAAMVLTKTPGLALFPAVFYWMWARCEYNRRRVFPPALISAGVSIGLLLCYGAVVRRFSLTADFRHLFAVNGGGVNHRTLLPKMGLVLIDARSIGPVLLVLSLGLIALALSLRSMRRPPLLVTCILGVAGYGAFITYKGWIEPRYYLVTVPLLVMAAVLILSALAERPERWARGGAAAAALALMVSCVVQIGTIVAWLRHPSYSYIQAARTLSAEMTGERVVLGSVSQEAGLLTGEPGLYLTDVDGLWPLRDEVLAYHPRWYLGFDGLPGDTRQALKGIDTIEYVDSVPAYGDDWGHHRLILYRLDPVTR